MYGIKFTAMVLVLLCFATTTFARDGLLTVDGKAGAPGVLLQVYMSDGTQRVIETHEGGKFSVEEPFEWVVPYNEGAFQRPNIPVLLGAFQADGQHTQFQLSLKSAEILHSPINIIDEHERAVAPLEFSYDVKVPLSAAASAPSLTKTIHVRANGEFEAKYLAVKGFQLTCDILSIFPDNSLKSGHMVWLADDDKPVPNKLIVKNAPCSLFVHIKWDPKYSEQSFKLNPDLTSLAVSIKEIPHSSISLSANGDGLFWSLPKGIYTLMLSSGVNDEYMVVDGGSVTIDQPDKTVEQVLFVKPRLMQELSGTVVARVGGKPISHATVVVGGNVYTSDEKGRFVGKPVVAGSKVTVQADGYYSKEIVVAPPPSNLQVELNLLPTLMGKLTVDDKPIDFATIDLVKGDSLNSGKTHDGGLFMIPAIPQQYAASVTLQFIPSMDSIRFEGDMNLQASKPKFIKIKVFVGDIEVTADSKATNIALPPLVHRTVNWDQFPAEYPLSAIALVDARKNRVSSVYPMTGTETDAEVWGVNSNYVLIFISEKAKMMAFSDEEISFERDAKPIKVPPGAWVKLKNPGDIDLTTDFRKRG